MFRTTLTHPYFRISFLLMLSFTCVLEVQAQSNNPPVAVGDTFNVRGLLNVSAPGVLANDFDPDGDPIGYQNPTQGSISATPHGTIITWSNGALTYAPHFGYVGTDSISYSVCDNQGACSNSATITFNVTNQPPNVGSDSYTVHSWGNF